MEKIYGNELGLVIDNRDPEGRGRVKVYVPHIMPFIYEGWTQDGKDVAVQGVGGNLAEGLTPQLRDILLKVLPWAEPASPVFGGSAPGVYNNSTNTYHEANAYSGPPSPATGGSPQAATGALFGGNKVYEQAALDAIANSTLLSQPAPADAAAWFPDGVPTAQGYASLLSSLMQRESDGNPKSYNPNDPGKSYGLYEMSPNDTLTGGGGNKTPWTAEQLADPRLNTQLAVAKLALLTRNGQPLTSPGKGLNNKKPSDGAGEYWAVLRPGYNSKANGNESKFQAEVKANTARLANKTVKENPDASSNDATNSVHSSVTPPVSGLHLAQDQPVSGTNSVNAPPAAGSGAGGYKTPQDLAQLVKDNPNLYQSGQTKPLYNTLYPTPPERNGYNHTCAAGASGLINAAAGTKLIQNGGNGADYGPGGIGAQKLLNSGLWTQVPLDSNYTQQNMDVISFAGSSNNPYGHLEVSINGVLCSDKMGDSLTALAGSTKTLYRLTPEGVAYFQKAGNIDMNNTSGFAGNVADGHAPTGTSAGDARATDTQSMVKNPTETQIAKLGTTNMPKGMFNTPSVGAMLWMFFRGGNPMHPVYFAASYGASEWASAYQARSPSSTSPWDAPSDSPHSNQTLLAHSGNGIRMTGNQTPEADNRQIEVFHPSGAHMAHYNDHSTLYHPNELHLRSDGNQYNYCLNRENWTQGVKNDVTIGDHYTIVGNASTEVFQNAEQLHKMIDELNNTEES